MAVEGVVQYYRRLSESDLQRRYWKGSAPDDPREISLFETVMVGTDVIAIRQMTVEADGTMHRYSWEHIEDEWGFLTNQPMGDELGTDLVEIDQLRFDSAWSA